MLGFGKVLKKLEMILNNQKDILAGQLYYFHLQSMLHLKKWLVEMEEGKEKSIGQQWMVKKAGLNHLMVYGKATVVAEWTEKFHFFHNTGQYESIPWEIRNVNMEQFSDWRNFLSELC